MNPVVTIALLTLREAVRRRLVAACAAITIGLVALSAWGFDRLSHNANITSGEVGVAIPQALILFMFMFSFVVALSASAMASPAISAEAESGVLLSILARPVRRSEVLLGKWLGLATVILAYSAVVSGLEVGVVDWVSGFVPPNPVLVALYLFAEGAMLLTLTLLLSTRLSAIATGVVAIALFGAAWLAGVVGSLGTAFKISSLTTIGDVARYILPTDGLWHGAIYYLEPQSFVVQRLINSPDNGNPFFAQAPPAWTYLVWVGVWFLAVLAAAIVSFDRREL
jgi:ABC-type transport system involved in multi-copper enzyme maturation permease subunit